MRCLLDTCTLIWLAAEPSMLSKRAADTLSAPGTTILVSDISALELTLKWQAGKIELPEPPRQWVEHQLRSWRTNDVPLSREVIYRASELPLHHKDPFDRLLIASALVHDAAIVTPDELIRAYPVAVLW